MGIQYFELSAAGPAALGSHGFFNEKDGQRHGNGRRQEHCKSVCREKNRSYV